MSDTENESGVKSKSPFVFKFFDEKLEVEYILRIRSIFEEYVCPETGTFLMCTFNELLNGITRLWSLTQEMKRFSGEIHERLINLPILFMIVLIRIIEKEYTNEDHEKSTADPQVAEVLLPLFHDMKSKFNHFKKIPEQIIVFNTCLLHVRYLLNVVNADKQIKRMKWYELRVESCRIVCPLRETDIKVIKEALKHFKDDILPEFSKSEVKYNLKFVNKFPEVMEPTLEDQKEIAEFIYIVSSLMTAFSLLLLGLLQIIDPGSPKGGDIGANFPDSVFRGIYHGKKCHGDDFASMLNRCSQVNLTCIMSTSTSAEDYHENSEIISEFSEKMGNPKILTTLGVHPSYCENVFKKCGNDWKKVDEYFEKMRKIFEEEPKHLSAIGECGLDYARLFRSPKETQMKFFQRHFDLLAVLEPSKRPPMFLHMRDCLTDFIEILRKNKSIFPGGVVHSFTGSVEDVKELLEFSDDLFIGFNGCSLREEQGIQVAAMVPVDRIMIESDSPYCEMRPTHASRPYLTDFNWSINKALDKEKHSMDHPVRGRNEPTETRRVLRVLSKIKGIEEEELAEIIYKNTLKLFPKCEI